MKKTVLTLFVLIFMAVAFLPWTSVFAARERKGIEFVLIGGGNMYYNTSIEAALLNKYPGALIVNCSYMGLRMLDIAPRTQIYRDCVKKAKVAGYNIKALLIFQGENDTILTEDVTMWRSRFNAFVKNFLRDTKSSANTTIIYAQLGAGPDALRDGWNALMIEQQKNLKGRPHYRMIKTSDLPMPLDNIFFEPSAYPVITERYIKTILPIIKK